MKDYIFVPKFFRPAVVRSSALIHKDYRTGAEFIHSDPEPINLRWVNTFNNNIRLDHSKYDILIIVGDRPKELKKNWLEMAYSACYNLILNLIRKGKNA